MSNGDTVFPMFIYIYIYMMVSTQTYTNLKIYNHHTPRILREYAISNMQSQVFSGTKKL